MTGASFPGPYHIRPIASSDRDGLTRFYASLSRDSLEARFHGAMPGIGDATARFFCGPDHEHREGLVAEATDADGRPIIVGHVCLEPIHACETEMAIAVADSWQRRGLGRALLSCAIAWAQDRGVAALSASIRWSNGAMIGLIRSMGLPVTIGNANGGVVDATIDLGVPLPRAA
jgi:acetyltransferase